MNDLFLDVEEALAELASKGDPDAIAEHLTVQGIKGTPKSASRCAVARYLEKASGVTDFTVFPGSICTGHVDLFPNATGLVDLPAAVDRFARRFDQGCYPELVAE